MGFNSVFKGLNNFLSQIMQETLSVFMFLLQVKEKNEEKTGPLM